jgi:hypothetical protein
LFTFCRKLRERREAMPPVGARLSVDGDDGDDGDGAGVDRGGGRAALATFMLAMFTLARCRISSTYQTERQASGYSMRLID